MPAGTVWAENIFRRSACRVVRGRVFNDRGSDASNTGAKVAIIDDVLAKKLWPDGDALGQQIQFAGHRTLRAPTAGVEAASGSCAELSRRNKEMQDRDRWNRADDTRMSLFEKDPSGAIYLPFARRIPEQCLLFTSNLRSVAGRDSMVARPPTCSSNGPRCRSASIPILRVETRSRNISTAICSFGSCVLEPRCFPSSADSRLVWLLLVSTA